MIRRQPLLPASLIVFGGCTAISTAAPGAAPAFSDQTVASGLSASHSFVLANPFWRMVGGGTVIDFDNDGFQDIFFIGGGAGQDRLFRNLGNGAFADATAGSGLGQSHIGGGASVGDYDNDGDLDLYVTSFGVAPGPTTPGNNKLYRNNGDRTFTDVAAIAGVNTTDPINGSAWGSAFGDYDLDGDLDLFVGSWFPNEALPGPNEGNRLFRNNGDGTFTDVTDTTGAAVNGVYGFSPRFIDMNGDRYPELLIAADFWTTQYLVNNGDGTFTNQTAASGVAAAAARYGMGHTFGDFDRDGDFDWYVSSVLDNRLYINDGADQFTDIAPAAGVDLGGWGWGTVGIDFDHDGWTDIIETNGWSEVRDGIPVMNPTYAWKNNGDNTFTEMHAAIGLVHLGQGRSLCNLDYDNDGDQDLVIFCCGEPMSLWRNDLGGQDIHWLRVFLDTNADDRLAPNGFGTRISVTAGGVTQVSCIDGGANYLGASELSAHFGFGEHTVISELRIEWNNGVVTTLTNVPADQTMTITAAPPGDINGDLTVDTADLGILIAAFGDVSLIADINGDGVVDTADLGILIANFGS